MTCEEGKEEQKVFEALVNERAAHRKTKDALFDLSKELEREKLMLQFSEGILTSKEEKDDRREYWRLVFTWSVIVPFVIGAVIFHAVAAYELALKVVQ